MILKYGAYAHAQNECAVVIRKRAIFSPRGFRQSVRETWHVTGFLQGTDQAAVTQAIAALRAAYSVNGLDLALYLDDGTTLTDHALFSRNTLGGVRVAALDFPQGTGAEYSTFRSYVLTLEADFPDAAPNLLEYDEALSFRGTGGPRRVFIDTLEGLPQEQIGTQRTTCRATQQGRAVGQSSYPAVPPPIWPAVELQEQREIVLRVPEQAANNLTRFAVTWRYVFESPGVLSGNPTLP